MSANSTILGDSWVVEAAATPPPRKRRHESPSNSQAPRATTDPTKKAPPSPSDTRANEDGSESMATSASSISGPELIMPSIYETPVPEGSWVAPNVRSLKQKVKRRHHGSERTQSKPSNPSSPKDRAPPAESDRHPQNNTSDKPSPLSPIHRLQPTLRAVLNIFLLAAIAHLLVLPELITQHQTFFCAIPAIPSLYPSSCQPPHFLFPGPVQSTDSPTTNPPPRTPEEKLARHATRLEGLFTTTLTTLTPLSPLLKQSEIRLRALQSDLRASFRGSRHELELEFSGLWEAARSGSRKFDSLSADLRSAIDNLIATGLAADSEPPGGAAAPAHDANGGGWGSGRGGGGGHEAAHASGHANAKAQARAAQITSAQLSRREGYLEQLTSRMQGKADALASDLATVEDHLESIERIILREERHYHHGHQQNKPGSSSSSSSSAQPDEQEQDPEEPVDDSFIAKIPLLSRLHRLGPNGLSGGVRQAPSRKGSDPSKHAAFVAATTGHRAVAEAVRNLSQRLDAVQRRRVG